MTPLTAVLLTTTLIVRWLAGNKNPVAWWLDICTIPLWSWFYIEAGAWLLLPIPFLFGAIDVRNIIRWREPRYKVSIETGTASRSM